MADKLLAEWFWTDRWMGSSGFLLPMEARGVYREMLTQAWRRGARLPNDPESIQRAIGCTSAEWERAWPKVSKYWTIEGDHLVNVTQLEVYAEAVAQASGKAAKAKKAAESRWGNAQAYARAHAQALPEQCPPSPSPSPTNNGSSVSLPSTSKESVDLRESLEERETFTRNVVEEFYRIRGYELPEISTRDFALIQLWFDDGIPLRIVLRGMADCLEGIRKRKAKPDYPLTYYDSAVREAEKMWRKAMVGAA